MPGGDAQAQPGLEPGDRFAGIDVTRAVAALAVLASHVLQALTWRIPGWEATAGRTAPVVHTLTGTAGAWGVGLFLVVSGLCIHLPMARRLAGNAGVGLDLRAFYRRRFLRIYPPYLAAVVLSAAVAWALPAAVERAALIQLPRTAQVVSHLLLIHTALPGHDSAISAVFWTIALEAHFYALYPVLLALRRRVGMAGLCATLLGVAVAARLVALALFPSRYWILVDESILRRGWEFCLGMWVAERLAREPQRRAGARLAWSALALLTLAGGVAVAFLPGGLRARAFLWPLLFAAAVEAAARWIPGAAAPERLLRWLGERSYSLYLVHPVGLALATWLLVGRGAPPAIGCAGMLLCTAAVLLPFYQLVERPFALRRAVVPWRHGLSGEGT